MRGQRTSVVVTILTFLTSVAFLEPNPVFGGGNEKGAIFWDEGGHSVIIEGE